MDLATAGSVVDSIGGRVFGCFSGCVSAGMTLGFTAMILAYVGWQLWITTKSMPQPTPAPAPTSEHGRSGKRR